MSGFLEKYNIDEVFLRGIIVGLLRSLNEKVTYTQINEQQEILEVYIPFFYSMSGDESFLQDFYLDYLDCDGNSPFAEGNYDIIPRGVVTLTGVNIDTASITNGFVRATYNVETVEGQMKAFSAYTSSIPLIMSFDIKLRADTLLDTFKIFQSVIQTFYKVYSFNVEFGGMRVPVQVGFPEQYQNDKQLEFSYLSTQKYIETTFSIVVETYYPQKDIATERFRGNLMQAGIKLKLSIGDTVIGSSSLFTTPANSSTPGLPSSTSNLPTVSVPASSTGITLNQISGYYINEDSVNAQFASLQMFTGAGVIPVSAPYITYIDMTPLDISNKVLGTNLFITVSCSSLAGNVIATNVSGSTITFQSSVSGVDFYFTGIYT